VDETGDINGSFLKLKSPSAIIIDNILKRRAK
jgi:hypothetical protein